MLAHGERGGREGKGIGKPGFRTEDRQTTTQTVTCPRQPPTPCSLPDIPINHVGTPHLGITICLPPGPKELALWRGVLVALFVFQRPSPWVLLERYLGP